MPVPEARLGPSAMVILGLLASVGPATPYDLRRAIASSIGYFWPFPHAQLYVETARLASLGLVTGAQEPAGRRRRVHALTPAGRAALQTWLEAPTTEMAQFRDIGLLKLAFGSLMDVRSVGALAAYQAAAHADRLQAYEGHATAPMERHLRAALELGLRYERAALAFWEELRADPGR